LDWNMEQTGMKTGWWRNASKANGQAIADATQAEGHESRNQSYATRNAHIMSCGWADKETAHIKNAHQFFMGDIRQSINATDFDKSGFKGNAGSCRFQAPYWDAADKAFIAGASRMDSWAAGYQAMMDTYDHPAPFWAWWN